MGTNIQSHSVIQSKVKLGSKFNQSSNLNIGSSVSGQSLGDSIAVTALDNYTANVGGCFSSYLIKKHNCLPLEKCVNSKGKSVERITYVKRARSKFVGDPIKKGLLRLNSPLKDSYYGSCLCNSELVQQGNKVISRYCNARWCITCNRIRTAKAITGYYDQFVKMDHLYFLTLTIPNVLGDQLNQAFDLMEDHWRKIRKLMWKQLKGIKDNGVRKTECTFNVIRDDYHPHFHILIDSLESAQFIKKQWLNRFPQARPWCQDIRKVDDRENSLMELFKYTTKIFMKVSETAKNSNLPIDEELNELEDFNQRNPVHFEALDQIFQSMVGRRVYQSFGKIRKVSEDVDQMEAQEVSDIEPEVNIYRWRKNDWVSNDISVGTSEQMDNIPDPDTGEVVIGFSGYWPDQAEIRLVRNIEANPIFKVKGEYRKVSPQIKVLSVEFG